MGTIKVDISKTSGAVGMAELDAIGDNAGRANGLLHTGEGAGREYLGWVGLPSAISRNELDEMKRVADELRAKADVIVSIGIGGSFLGAKAVVEALGDSFGYLRDGRGPQLVFAGQNLSGDYARELLDALEGRSIAVVVISKSGTTLEPAIAFRIFREELRRRYGREEAARRIVVVTDASDGALHRMAQADGYREFAIPGDVGGRYSVLSPAGLFPAACAGVDIAELVRGGRDMQGLTGENIPFEKNPAAMYAAVRNILYGKGFKIEILGSYEPKLQCFGEWWKQLFGESEGKDGRGIFPATANFSTDLHSIGQYIQDGERTIFETVLSVEEPAREVVLAGDADDSDGLNYLAGRCLGEVNRMAELGASMAHVDGGVPNIRIVLPAITPYYIGALLYFFEKACGISGYLLGVNPFDQPGVEAYKKNMFALLDTPR